MSTGINLKSNMNAIELHNYPGRVFFSSDLHFYHKNIIKYSNRPFTDIDDMREGLITNHNSLVGPKDVWFHLGDFAFTNSDNVRRILSRMNGYKIFLKGNHCNWNMLQAMLREGLIDELHRDWIGKIKDHSFHIYHFPIQSWENAKHGTIHLHGHSHGSTPSPKMLRLDVGVDCHNWFPVSYESIVDWAKIVKEEMGGEFRDPGRDRMK
jgi:calcineurin-like phosphoesterase family protein